MIGNSILHRFMRSDLLRHLGFWLLFFAFCLWMKVLVGIATAGDLDVIFWNVLPVIYGCYLSYYFFAKTFRRKNPVKSIIGFFQACLLFVLAYFIQSYVVEPLIYTKKIHFPQPLVLNRFMVTALWLYLSVTVLSLCYFFGLQSLLKERNLQKVEKEKLEMENEKVLAEHAFLRAQINPHFLHNTLSLLYAKSLMSCPDVADAILILDDIMRYAMENKQDNKNGVLITREIEQIKKLIQIYQLRYADRLFVHICQEGDLTTRRIIPLVLITLVENAFKHGDLENPVYPVQINAIANGECFLFNVKNRKRDGPKEISHGIGLDNLRKRLSQAYGNEFNLEIKNEEHSYEASLEIKYSI